MRDGWAVLLGILGLTAGSTCGADVQAAATAAHALIERCSAQTEPSLRGLEELAAACPGIEPAIEQLGIEPLLPADWQRQLSPRALADLDALAIRYAGSPPSAALQANAPRLRALALDLKPPPTPVSWWERLGAWIRQWLGPAGGHSLGWLRFLPHFSIGLRLRVALLAALGLLVAVVVGALVVIEMKAAGVGSSRRRRPHVRTSPGVGPARAGPPDLADLDSAPVRQRPVLLLRALVAALARVHRLDHDRDLTCRELVARARFDTTRQREDFEHVALLAERALYGGRLAESVVVPEDVLLGARALHAALCAEPAA